MTRTTTSKRPAIFLAAFSLAASITRAQSYGDQDQVLTVGAAAFRSLDGFETAIDAVGYLRHDGEDVFLAPLQLPEGALLESFCLYSDDGDPDPSRVVQSHIVAIKQVPPGETPALKVIGEQVFSSSFGYGVVCGNILATLRGRIDVDGDGAGDPVAYYVHVQFPGGAIPLGVGGVRITWRRQVSAPTGQTFADVPASDPAFGYVEALAASGITAGCSGGNYCPDAKLTRRQMAVFLAKALGLHWTD